MKKSSNLTILLIVIIVLVFNKLFSSIPLVANDFPYISQDELKALFSIPYGWWSRGSAGLGEYSVPFLWFWPLDNIYGLGANLGFQFSFLERVVSIFPALTLGVFGIRKVLRNYLLSNVSVFVGSSIYIFNTYFLLLIDGGQLSIALSYAWFPFVFISYIEAYKSKSLRLYIRSALFTSILAFMDIRFVFILVLIILVNIMYELLFLKRNQYWNFIGTWIVIGSTTGIVLIGLLAYMIMPALFAKGGSLPHGYDRVSQTNFLSFTTIGNSILLLQPHWYKNVFGVLTPLSWGFIGIPILAFLAPLLYRSKKVSNKFNESNESIGFWLLIALLGIFLTKGSNEPLGEIYTFLFTFVPGFSLFRDSTKFFILVSLSYSVLSAFSISALIKKSVWKLNLNILKAVVIVGSITYVIFLTVPIWADEMTGTLSIPRNLSLFEKVEKSLINDKSFGRVLWIPAKSPLSYSDTNHPTLEASRIVQSRPFAIGVVGSYEVFNFLRDAPFMNQIMNISGIKYVVYPYPDEKRQTLKPDEKDYYDMFLEQLESSRWSEKKLTEKPMPVLKTKESEDRFFVAPNHYYVLGSDRIYWDLEKIPGFDLSKNAFTFLEEGRTPVIDPSLPIILYNKTSFDLVMSAVSPERLRFPANDIPFEPDKNGLWKREASDLISWRAFLQDKYTIDNLDFDYGGGWMVLEGEKELRIENLELSGENVFLIRAMESSRGGKISLGLGDQTIGEVDTSIDTSEVIQLTQKGSSLIPDKTLEYRDSNIRWFEVGTNQLRGDLSIKSMGDINVINAIAFVPKSDWEAMNNEIDNYRVKHWNLLTQEEKGSLFQSESSSIARYRRINPTHYKVHVSGVLKPETLIFSESYHPGWELNGEKPILSYSFLNGYRISEDGEYDLYFAPQKYVNFGFYVSGLTLVLLIVLIIRFSKKYNKHT